MKPLVFVVVALAGCASQRDAVSAAAAADRTNATSDRAFAERVDEERSRLGAARFEPAIEAVGFVQLAPPPPGTTPSAPPSRAIVHPSGARFRIEDGRVGYTSYTGDLCSGWPPPIVPLFARSPAGVRIVLVKAKVEWVEERVPGRCGMAGCGIPPGPPMEHVSWLGVADPNAITVDVVEVPYRRAQVTCDQPSFPP